MQARRCKLKNKFFEKFPLPSEGEGQVEGEETKEEVNFPQWGGSKKNRLRITIMYNVKKSKYKDEKVRCKVK